MTLYSTYTRALTFDNLGQLLALRANPLRLSRDGKSALLCASEEGSTLLSKLMLQACLEEQQGRQRSSSSSSSSSYSSSSTLDQMRQVKFGDYKSSMWRLRRDEKERIRSENPQAAPQWAVRHRQPTTSLTTTSRDISSDTRAVDRDLSRDTGTEETRPWLCTRTWTHIQLPPRSGHLSNDIAPQNSNAAISGLRSSDSATAWRYTELEVLNWSFDTPTALGYVTRSASPPALSFDDRDVSDHRDTKVVCCPTPPFPLRKQKRRQPSVFPLPMPLMKLWRNRLTKTTKSRKMGLMMRALGCWVPRAHIHTHTHTHTQEMVIACAVAHLDTGSQSPTGDSKLARYAAVVQTEEAAARLVEDAKTAMHHAGGVAGMRAGTGGDEGGGVLCSTMPKPWVGCVSRIECVSTTEKPATKPFWHNPDTGERTLDRPVRRQVWEAAGRLIGAATERSDYC